MDGGVSGINLATQNALHPLHGMRVDINESGQNRLSVQVKQLGAGTGATCKRVVLAEGEDSPVTHSHGADHAFRSVHRNDVAIAQEQVSILAGLGDRGREADGRKQCQSSNPVSAFHWFPRCIRAVSFRKLPYRQAKAAENLTTLRKQTRSGQVIPSTQSAAAGMAKIFFCKLYRNLVEYAQISLANGEAM